MPRFAALDDGFDSAHSLEIRATGEAFVDGALVGTLKSDGTISTSGRSMSLFQEDGTFRLPQNGRIAAFDGPPSARRAIVVVFATSMQLGRAQKNSERREEPAELAAGPDTAE